MQTLDIASIFFQMLILFATVAVGFCAGRLKLVGPDFNRSLSRLILNFTAPAMVVHSVIGAEHVLSRREVLSLTLIALLSYALLLALAQVLPRLLRIPKAEQGLWKFMTIFSNVSFMGFPVVQAIYGPEAVFFAAIFQIPFNLLCFTYGARLIAGDRMGPLRIRQFFSPMVISTAVAYVLYLCNWQAPTPLVQLFNFPGQITSPGAMIILGVSLSAMPLKSLFTDWRVYVLSFFKLLLLPAAVFFALRGMVENTLILGVTVVMMAMPVATNTNMLVAQYDGDQHTAARGVFLSTLLSVGSIPLLMWLLF